MPLIKCSDCGHEISTSAAACPNCGAPRKAGVPPELPVQRPKRRKLWLPFAIGGGALVLILILMAIFAAHHPSPSASSKVEAAIRATMQQQLSQTKQERFENILLDVPGSAVKDDVVDRVTIQWKTAEPTENLNDVSAFTVDHTLYWRSLMHQDGYTKISDSYDSTTGTPHLTDSKVIESNGLTKKKVFDMAVQVTTQQIENKLKEWGNSSPTPTP